jgi:hypothetical protein
MLPVDPVEPSLFIFERGGYEMRWSTSRRTQNDVRSMLLPDEIYISVQLGDIFLSSRLDTDETQALF